MAPFAHCPPATRGWKKPRELPEHWLTAANSTRGSAAGSVSDSDSGLSTWPRTVRRKLPTSIAVGMTAQCQRTKKRSFGVKTPLVEHLERRFQQRRPRALQDHLALSGKGVGDRPLADAAGERERHRRLGQRQAPAASAKSGGAQLPKHAAARGHEVRESIMQILPREALRLRSLHPAAGQRRRLPARRMAVKACPMPRTRTNFSAPSCTFLSRRIWPISLAAENRRFSMPVRTASRYPPYAPSPARRRLAGRGPGASTAGTPGRCHGHALAMQEAAAIAVFGFQRMAEGVAQVQQSAAVVAFPRARRHRPPPP